MTAETWQRIKEVFESARTLPPTDQRAYLETACIGDPEVRRHVEAMLAVSEDANDFLETPALANASQAILDALPRPPTARQIGPYRILRQVGEGGMGSVFEAEPASPNGQRVAIKVIRRGMESEFSLARFITERKILGDLDHPNIGRLLDGGTTEDGLPYLVMEFIDGQLIHEYCDDRRMPIRERLVLFRSVCSAVQHAHEQRVIHRDLKPGNIVVRSDGVAKLLDFGIAKIIQHDSSRPLDPTLTIQRVATPDYASPEQLRGEVVTPASDIYSLGVVLYELLTGHRPHRPRSRKPDDIVRAICEEETEKPSVAVNRVEEVATRQGAVTLTPEVVSQRRGGDPQLLQRRLAGDLDTVVLKAMHKDAARRYSSATELSDDIGRYLDGLPVKARPDGAGYRVGKFVRRQRMAVSAAAVMLVALLVAGFSLWYRPRITPRFRTSVAVIGFKNLSGRTEVAWVSTALSEMLTSELAASGKLRTISGEQVARAKSDLSLQDSESFAAPTLQRIRANLGADYVVLGSYLALGDKSDSPLRVYLRLQDARTGAMIGSSTDTGTAPELPAVVFRTSAGLREKLGIPSDSNEAASRARLSGFANPSATRFYVEGLDKLRLSEFLAARKVLGQAVETDPKNPLSHIALARAIWSSGNEKAANEQGKLAFDLSGGLSREQQLQVEGQYCILTSRWDRAIAIFKGLWEQYYDNTAYGLRLVEAQTQGGHARDALATVAALRKLPEPVRNDPEIDVLESVAASYLTDYELQRQAGVRARESGRRIGSRSLVARAYYLEGLALFGLLRRDEARQANEEALKIYSEIGDRNGLARSLNTAGLILFAQHDSTGALKAYDASLAICRDIGAAQTEAYILGNSATTLDNLGRYEEASQKRREAIAIHRSRGDLGAVAMWLSNEGKAVSERGDLSSARKAYEEAAGLARETGQQKTLATSQINLVSVLHDQGDLAGAEALAREGLATARNNSGPNGSESLAWFYRQLGSVLRSRGKLSEAKQTLNEYLALARKNDWKSHTNAALSLLSDVAFDEGDLSQARQLGEQSLSLAMETKDEYDIAKRQQSLARIALEEGRFADAEALARKALDYAQTSQILFARIEALETLSLVSMLTGKLPESRRLDRDLQTLLAKNQAVPEKLSSGISSARVQATAQAIHLLRAVQAEATKLGWRGYELEARLRLGEIEMRLHHSGAREQLAQLDRDAQASGYGRIARVAASLAK